MFNRFAQRARIAVVVAQETARDHGNERITPSHLLIGVLDSAANDLRDDMAELGVTVEAVRAAATDRVLTSVDEQALAVLGIDLGVIAETVSRRFGYDIRGPIRKVFRTGWIPFSSATKKVLEHSVREATQRHDRQIRSEHLMLAIVRAGDPDVLAAIESLATSDRLTELMNRRLEASAA